jgi:cell division protein ZapA
MEEKKHTVKVNIYGEEYPIKADIDSSYIIRVAQFVDKKMREVAERSSQRVPVKVAVLTAMNIADELFKEKEDKDKKLSLVEEKAQTLLEWLDKRLVEE